MQICILGPLEVRVGDAPSEVRRGLPRTLLIALLLRAPETLTTDALVELLWGDKHPQNPANALQIQISYLRKVLGPAGRRLVTRPGGYFLDVEPEEVDAGQFERMVRDAMDAAARQSSADLLAALALLDEARGLWRGEALADVGGEAFARADITRLEEMRWTAVELRNDVLLGLGRHRELVGELSRIVSAEPLRERFYEQLMVALYRSGRQADALRIYDQARAVLLDELGLDPGPRLKQLEHDVLSQAPSLEWTPVSDRNAELSSSPSTPAAAARALVVPIPMTPLVGREVETARIRDLFGRSRLVTLTGPAGTGKSRLALEVAHGAADDGAVWFVDFSGLGSGDLVAHTVAAALGVATLPDEDAGEAVAHALSRQHGLLLLDTCEHVIEGAAALATSILRAGPAIRILATSRRPLRITGEIAWPVPPLALPPPGVHAAEEAAAFPAVTLFCDRAAAVRPDFRLTDSNAADVAAICLSLDGLPLAIELAAASVDVLSPAAIRSRLEHRFDLLVEGGSDLAARQQTLRAAIDWSFDLLTPAQRRFFVRLGVFAGSFDLEAATAVAHDGPDDPLTVLGALVRQSMVVVTGDRYRLLDTLRAYAGERLAPPSGAGTDANERHARFYTKRAEEEESLIRGHVQAAALERLQADVGNFRAALEWSFATGQRELAARLTGALAWFWALRGMLDEAIRHLDRALALPDLGPLVRAKLLWGVGLLAASLGDLGRARQAGYESADLARRAGDDDALGSALNTVAVAEWALGNHHVAAEAHDEAIRSFVRAGNTWGLAICTVLRARTALDAGEVDAMTRARAALPVAEACGDRHVVGIALEQIARAELVAGDVAAAVDAAARALRAQEAIGYTEGTIAALHLLGRTQTAAGNYAEARRLHRRALELSSRIGHVAAMCEALEDVARIEVAEGAYGQALRLLDAAQAQRTRRNLPLQPADQLALEAVEQLARDGLAATGRTPAPLTDESEVISEMLGLADHRSTGTDPNVL